MELDKCIIGGIYNNTGLKEGFQGEMNIFINKISILECSVKYKTINDYDGRNCFFESSSALT